MIQMTPLNYARGLLCTAVVLMSAVSGYAWLTRTGTEDSATVFMIGLVGLMLAAMMPRRA